MLPCPDGPDWITILQANYSWLSSVVYARLRDRHAVEVVLQETALAASKQKEATLDAEHTSRWLYRVAIRQALLYRRNQQRREKKHNGLRQQASPGQRKPSHSASSRYSAESSPILSTDQDPYQLLLASEQQALVQEALQKLKARDCEILMLKYNEGWSCREIASRVGVSEEAIKSRLLRARRHLRTELLRLNENWDCHE